MAKKITQAFILGAGLGTRLRPLTETVPKVMLPIAPGKPLLEHTIELLRDQGIRDFVINVHYLPGAITSHFGDGRKFGVHIVYSDETKQLLETAGALKKAEPLLDDQFLFIYGDHLFFFDFKPLIKEHSSRKTLATIVLKMSEYPEHGEIGVFEPMTQKITRWHTRPHDITTLDGARKANSGLYALSKKIIDGIPVNIPMKFDGEVIPRLLAEGNSLFAFPTDEAILDIGSPKKYQKAKKYYRERKK